MIVALILAAVTLAAAPQPVPTPQHLPEIVLRAPAAQLHVGVARTEHEREIGLMGVRALAPHHGMLFVFEQDGPVGFWMKDTLIPLDMVFIGADGRVRTIDARVPVVAPSLSNDRIPIENGNAKYVLELPSGEAATDGLRPGAVIAGIPHD